MATTPSRSGSLDSHSSMRTKHDGHVDGNLNCIALYVCFNFILFSIAERHDSLYRRHGWSRAFTIAPEEIPTLDYTALEDILELNTLKLRPVGLKIFIEHPPDSNRWAKVRPWKQDASLVTLLLNDFFERRRRDGVVLRIDVRDGHERPANDAGSGFASAVGSFIAGSVRSEREREQIDKAWWRLGRDRLLSSSTSTNATRHGGAAEETDPPRTPPPKLKKVRTMRGSLAVAFPPSAFLHPLCLPLTPCPIRPFRLSDTLTDKNDDRYWGIVRTAVILLLPRTLTKIAATNTTRTRTTAVHLRLVSPTVVCPPRNEPSLAPGARG
jgi:hypothetical protein